jgi:hypothetical protein
VQIEGRGKTSQRKGTEDEEGKGGKEDGDENEELKK